MGRKQEKGSKCHLWDERNDDWVGYEDIPNLTSNRNRQQQQQQQQGRIVLLSFRNCVRESPYYDEMATVEHSMEIWGIKPRKYEHHRIFWDQMRNAVNDCLKQTGAFYLYELHQALLEDLRSLDPEMAVRKILSRDIDGLLVECFYEEKIGQQLGIVQDKLIEQFPDLPFRPPYYKEKGQIYKRMEFNYIDDTKLDPLVRFRYILNDAKTVIREQYLGVDGHGNMRSCVAVLLRALIIQQACSWENIQCVACKEKPNTLLWNRGTTLISHQWRRIECATCGAFYDVKPVTALQSKINRNNNSSVASIDGATFFGSYHQVRKRFPEKKIFLIMIDNSCLEHKTSTTKKTVFVAEIEGTSPYLKSKSFVKSEKPFIYTTVKVKNVRKWFELSLGRRYQPVEYVRSVLEESFAKSDRKAAARKKVHGSTTNETGNKDEYPCFSEMEENDLKDYHRGLRKQLHQIRILKRKKVTELTPDENNLLQTEEQIERQVAKCKNYL